MHNLIIIEDGNRHLKKNLIKKLDRSCFEKDFVNIIYKFFR